MFGRRATVRSKLLLGLIAIGAFVVSTALVVVWQQVVVRRSFVVHDRMMEIELALLECRREEKNFFLRQDAANSTSFSTSLQSLLGGIPSLRSEARGAEFGELLTRLDEATALYGEQFERASGSAWIEADQPERNRLMAATVAAARACHDQVENVTEVTVSRPRSASRTTQRISMLTVAAGLLLALAVCWWLARTIADPLEQLRGLAERVSSGDIQDMDVEFGDLDTGRFGTHECYELALALQKMITNLRLLVSTERGLMDHYHMTIMVLVHRAVGPASWSVIERARVASGYSSFSEVRAAGIDRFVSSLAAELRPLIPEETVQLLVGAILELEG